jgi:hypothetical protein
MKTRIARILTGASVALLLLANPAWLHAAPPNPPPPTAPPPPTEPPPPPEPKPKKVFIFPGGNPVEFILAMDRHFRTRLNEILSVPHALIHAQVPKMKLATENPAEPLTLYNRLGDPLLGRWVWEGPIDPATNVHVLTLVPDKSVAGTLQKSGTRVKAIALAGVPKSQWRALQEDIGAARKVAAGLADKQSGPDGEIHIQPTSKVLIVSGSDEFIEMVESVVAAHRANAELEGSKFSNTEEKPAEK